MRRARLIPLLLLSMIARTLDAQWQANVDLGVSRIEQTGIPESNAQTLGVNADAFVSRFRLVGNWLTARTSESRWTTQALGAASTFGRLGSRVQWELGGIASVFAETNAQTASSAEVIARGYYGTARFGSSLALGGGTRRADAGRQPLGRAIANVWTNNVAGRLGAEVSHVHTTTTPFVGQPRITLTYTDASAGWRGDFGRVAAGAVFGVRTSNNAIVPDGGWGSADVTASMTSRIALVVSGGQSPQDVVRGVPRIRYVSGALRIALQPRVWRAITPARRSGPNLLATRDGIEIRVAAATRIEVMADFTDWSPVELTKAGDTWRLERTITPGLHRLVIRVDGGAWMSPANLPTATDDLGGVVALVAVP
jgi:hypothetical protein